MLNFKEWFESYRDDLMDRWKNKNQELDARARDLDAQRTQAYGVQNKDGLQKEISDIKQQIKELRARLLGPLKKTGFSNLYNQPGNLDLHKQLLELEKRHAELKIQLDKETNKSHKKWDKIIAQFAPETRKIYGDRDKLKDLHKRMLDGPPGLKSKELDPWNFDPRRYFSDPRLVNLLRKLKWAAGNMENQSVPIPDNITPDEARQVMNAYFDYNDDSSYYIDYDEENHVYKIGDSGDV